MSEHPNAQMLRELVDAWFAGDTEAVAARYTDDTVMRTPGAGVLHGRDELFAWFKRFSEAGARLELGEVLADDDHTISFWKCTGQRGDKSFEATVAQAARVNADGQFTEVWQLPSDQKAWEAFFA